MAAGLCREAGGAWPLTPPLIRLAAQARERGRGGDAALAEPRRGAVGSGLLGLCLAVTGKTERAGVGEEKFVEESFYD